MAETVARGDLSRAPHDDGNDELGRLMGALGNMVDSLSNMEASAISRPPQIV
ncbi:MAG TPA: HAMP domain-containing protein [Accumulibacter sp.]|uniref:HAMP domain-containing protein n=1 Tax=Candidatus Accumulibacter TaxID=327159 RepID=UPI001AC2D77E|nr:MULTISPECIES: HAMP domain-containing protein [Candidatus Accumulibacter]MBN8519701.1 HAMP domain-containing protein [Accumulibacter sp.]MBO3711689.1 HAMP domain-containing protein [Accumulibacter sp.]MCM8622969.1 HAMP domain-containing protein [Accumulibacter sp.]MCQ1547312.1 HAMP domain-containing protein [Candidatus Accumulibacter phosphatis]HMW56116.1 HAMP domain-containing protein [Accumulibacter sp.]